MDWFFLGLIISGLMMLIQCVELIVHIEKLTKDIFRYMPWYLCDKYAYTIKAKLLYIFICFLVTIGFVINIMLRLP